MLSILNVWTQRVQFSLYIDLLKLLLLLLWVLLQKLLLQNVRTREGVWLSLYTYILKLIFLVLGVLLKMLLLHNVWIEWISVWFCFNAYILALLLPVSSSDQSYIRVFVCDVIVMEYKIK